MPEMPPKNQDLRDAENLDKIAESLRHASIQGSDFVANMAISLTVRLTKGLRAEGLDGGGFLSRHLRGGDAKRTASWVVEPLHAAAGDLYNAAVNFTIFKRRLQTGYVDAIRAARQPQGAASDTVVVK
jgi:hypothetical protein